jgi:glycosyltransferase involved in cell wall biosynthesis
LARVLLVFEPPDGGVAENVMQLALRLADHGFDPEVAGPRESVVYDRLERAGIPVRRVPFARGYGSPRQDARAMRALVSLIRRGGFDLVHCHSAKAGALGRAAARVAGRPSVYSPHCFGFVGDVSVRRRLFARTVERALGRVTAVIVCACETERRRALEAAVVAPERLRVVFYGVEDCPADGPRNPALLELRGEGPLAGAVTVLREQKRLDLLLEAARSVFERVPDARLAVVGNGPLRDSLEQQARELGLDRDERFRLLDFDPPSARHLLALDVFVLPSAWEAMPIGVLEALACGIPQVVTDVEGTHEAISDETGILIPPRDSAALADAMVALLRDEGRRARMSERSRERHAELFTVDRMVADTAAAYSQALGAWE